MSVVLPLLSNDNLAIPLGTLVVASGTAVRAYDPVNDTIDQIIGVTVPKTNSVVSYEICSYYYHTKTDSAGFDGYLRIVYDQNGNPVANENYDPNYNWTTDDACQAVMVFGTAAILNTQSSYIKPSWILQHNDSVTSIYFIK